MRNYRTLTADELKELERLYPVTTNRELSARFDISIDAIHDYLAKPRGWQKDMKAVRIGNRGGKTISEKELAWLIRHYKHTRNADIMQRLGIGETQLHRLARKYGLKKSAQQIRKMQAEASAAAHEVCKQYGIYEDTRKRMTIKMRQMYARGEYIPGSFEPGVTNEQRLGKKRNLERIEKSRQSRNESIRKDRIRIHFGLPQKTKMKLNYNGYTKEHRKKAAHRYLFRKHNYIVERGDDTVYYDDLTDRRPRMEAQAHLWGLRVMEAAD